MIDVIANSFGESSGMLDWTIRHELGRKDAISIFQNTGWEHPATIQFGKDQQKHSLKAGIYRIGSVIN